MSGAAQRKSTSKPKVIFDTDPGVDDILALLVLLASTEAELALITVTFGNTELKYAYNNILKTYQVVSNHIAQYPEDRVRFPGLEAKPTLCYGAAEPLAGKLHLAAYFHGPDGLSDITTTHPEFNIKGSTVISDLVNESNTPAEDAIIEVLLREPYDSVIVIAVGPLTNIARVWLKAPEALARARRIVVMGGALDAPGNTSATAEFNFFADPKAATIVMDAAKSESINLLLAPLDFTGWHSVPFVHMIHPLLLSGPLLSGSDLSSAMTPIRAFTSAIFYRVRRVMQDLGAPDNFEMHDPAAVWAALAHATTPRGAPLLAGWGAVKRDFVIECVGEYTKGGSMLRVMLFLVLTKGKGMCVVDRRGGTDKTGAVRSIDGVATSDSSDNQRFGVRVLQKSPGAAAMEKEITEKLFWDLRPISEVREPVSTS
ncbi:hypothetical protein FRC12_002321 [Ceratobasidium sp. 428]|nr:hypothetical protein FRC12_002321 [Ceratobasidium sp. 428]